MSEDKIYAVLKATGGTQKYTHELGEISTVTIDIAGMGITKIRIVNLSPETIDAVVCAALMKYGELTAIQIRIGRRNIHLRFRTGYGWLSCF